MPRRKAVENYIRYVTLHFRDQCVVASLRYKNCAEITVLKSEQKPYLVFVPAQKLSGIVWTPIQYVTFHVRDRHSAASFRYRNRAVITVLKCEQKPYLVFMAAQKLSGVRSVDTALENTEHGLYKFFSS